MVQDVIIGTPNIDGGDNRINRTDIREGFDNTEIVIEDIINGNRAVDLIKHNTTLEQVQIDGSGAITVTRGTVEVAAATPGADNLDTINMPDGATVYLKARAGDTITIRDNSVGTGNIYLLSGGTVTISGNLIVQAKRLGTNVAVIGDGNSAGGGGAPTTASYLTLALDATLSAERVFTPGAGLKAVDGGANANYTLSVNQGAEAIKIIDADPTGAIAVGSDRNILVAANTGTTGNLNEVTGLAVGETVWLRADAGDTITVKHNDAGATVKILLYGNADVSLDEENPLVLRLVATNVLAQDIDQTGGSIVDQRPTRLYVAPTVGITAVTSPVALATERDPASNMRSALASSQFFPEAGTYQIHGGGFVINPTNASIVEFYLYDTNAAAIVTDIDGDDVVTHMMALSIAFAAGCSWLDQWVQFDGTEILEVRVNGIVTGTRWNSSTGTSTYTPFMIALTRKS